MWRDAPDVVKRFIEQRPDYEQLCAEIAYIVRKQLTAAQIEVSSIPYRAKTLTTFLEKLARKAYEDPFKEITDFAGVRVVCLYPGDLKHIETIVARQFEVVERVDKQDELGVSEFGYRAVHYIVRLGRASSGARYDDLKQLVCEVQVRTVLQDAWAIIQHHLVYKRESQVPRLLQRKLNSLAGLFETADDQFEHLRTERATYVAEVRDLAKTPAIFLETEINLDSSREYLRWKFPDRAMEKWDGQLEMSFRFINHQRIKTLGDLEKIIVATAVKRDNIRKDLRDKVIKAEDGTVPAAVEMFWALYVSGDVGNRKKMNEVLPLNWRKVLMTYCASV